MWAEVGAYVEARRERTDACACMGTLSLRSPWRSRDAWTSDERSVVTPMIKLIKTPADYQAALGRLEELAQLPSLRPDETEQLEVLAVLIEEYERAQQPTLALDPVDAIVFRMEQLELQRRDLVPLIGGRSRVSEVLSRRRPLTLDMIRALHEHLGIPVEVLVRPMSKLPDDATQQEQAGSTSAATAEFPWERFPIIEMIKRGWLERSREGGRGTRPSSRADAVAMLNGFFAPLGGVDAAPALYRRATHVRSGREMDAFGLVAWTTRVLSRACTAPSAPAFDAATINDDTWLDTLVGLSRYEDGPRRAVEFLADVGVVVVIEPHLPRTHLDGAAMRCPDGRGVIGLTLRHDRIDNYWFTLMHELAHLTMHVMPDQGSDRPTDADDVVTEHFYDDLDVVDAPDPREQEADAWAGEILVPDAAWEQSAVAYAPSPVAAAQLADEIGVHEAIVAGKVRHIQRNYRVLKNLVGHGQVRRCFPDVNWPK